MSPQVNCSRCTWRPDLAPTVDGHRIPARTQLEWHTELHELIDSDNAATLPATVLVALPLDRIQRAAMALHARACLDRLGVPLGSCADYCVISDLKDAPRLGATP